MSSLTPGFGRLQRCLEALNPFGGEGAREAVPNGGADGGAGGQAVAAATGAASRTREEALALKAEGTAASPQPRPVALSPPPPSTMHMLTDAVPQLHDSSTETVLHR